MKYLYLILLSAIALTSCNGLFGDPNNPNNPDAKHTPFITVDGKLISHKIASETPPTELRWILTSFYSDGKQENSPKTYPYADGAFDITFPVPPVATLSSFTSGPTITPSTARFASGLIEAKVGDVWEHPTVNNIARQNGANTLIKKGEGEVSFIYATTDAVVNGQVSQNFTNDNGSPVGSSTVVFNNCHFRRGWNEMLLTATEDETASRDQKFEVYVNSTPSTFGWSIHSYSNDNSDTEEVRTNILKNERTKDSVYIVSYSYDRSSDDSFFLDFVSAGENNEHYASLILDITKVGCDGNLSEGVYSLATGDKVGRDNTFEVLNCQVGQLVAGVLEVEFVSGDYLLKLNAIDAQGGAVTMTVNHGRYDGPNRGEGNLKYVYNDAQVQLSVIHVKMLTDDCFELQFWQHYNLARKVLAFSMTATFKSENGGIGYGDYSGRYTFSQDGANLSPGTFYKDDKFNIAGDALYFVRGGTITISRPSEAKPGDYSKYIVEILMETSRFANGEVNSYMVGDYIGSIDRIF